MVANTPDPALCAGGECLDQVLIDRLRERLVTYDGNGVLILHVMGSHGPAYFRRYPPDFERFKPVCRTSELNDCSSQELLNAYDNTILYTDYILASVIDLLKQRDDLETVMYYMSDHGESLGENGLYLHGAPYMFAPEEQKRIPFIAWFSDSFARRDGLDVACLRARAGEELSHDNMFDTVLGLMDVQTDIYNPALDAFAACRSPATSSVMP
jgi:lipid A ethanolaminephosphotransferase